MSKTLLFSKVNAGNCSAGICRLKKSDRSVRTHLREHKRSLEPFNPRLKIRERERKTSKTLKTDPQEAVSKAREKYLRAPRLLKASLVPAVNKPCKKREFLANDHNQV